MPDKYFYFDEVWFLTELKKKIRTIPKQLNIMIAYSKEGAPGLVMFNMISSEKSMETLRRKAEIQFKSQAIEDPSYYGDLMVGMFYVQSRKLEFYNMMGSVTKSYSNAIFRIVADPNPVFKWYELRPTKEEPSEGRNQARELDIQKLKGREFPKLETPLLDVIHWSFNCLFCNTRNIFLSFSVLRDSFSKAVTQVQGARFYCYCGAFARVSLKDEFDEEKQMFPNEFSKMLASNRVQSKKLEVLDRFGSESYIIMHHPFPDDVLEQHFTKQEMEVYNRFRRGTIEQSMLSALKDVQVTVYHLIFKHFRHMMESMEMMDILSIYRLIAMRLNQEYRKKQILSEKQKIMSRVTQKILFVSRNAYQSNLDFFKQKMDEILALLEEREYRTK